MSSSVFVESSSATQRSAGDTIPCKTDSDLVVVYGKKGISFDQKGLENLIEEKKISSISVIRLSSPTPSMEAQEMEAEKNEELMKRDELGSSAASETQSDNDESDSELDEPEKKNFDTESSGIDDLNSSDEDNKSAAAEKQRGGKRNTRRKSSKAVKIKEGKLKRKKRKDRPQIVGLNVEEFYTGIEAHELLKTALKLAGVPTVKKTAEHEFMLYIIQNDHNYTPFTSPQQMKEKLAADKLEAEKAAALNSRRLSSIQVPVAKNPLIKKKDERVIQKVVAAKREPKSLTQNLNSQNLDSSLIEDDSELKTTDDDEICDGDEDLSDFSGFDESATSDNDRDSDLDFKLTNRKKSQKGKVFKKLKRNPLISKIISNKRMPINKAESTERNEALTVLHTPLRTANQNNSAFSKNAVVTSTPTPAATSVTKTLPTPEFKAAKVLPPTKPSVSTPTQNKQATIPQQQQSSPSIQITRKANIEHSSPQCVKEILINKVITSPKGVFTNISALLSDNSNTAEQATTTTTTFPTTPKSSQRPQIQIQTPSKGFTPLGLEAAEKNQLPSQISIQTHQSESEIAAENLDLLDAIVQGEMQKATATVSKEPDIAAQNIPELVKMLESTETALQPKDVAIENATILNPTETAKSSSVHIPNTLPLDTSNDVLPEDLLQHVVDLIEEDRTLKEAVEKQVFGTDSLMDSLATNTTPPPLTPISEQQSIRKSEQTDSAAESTKSIIQMSISNVPHTTSGSMAASNVVKQVSEVASTAAGSSVITKATPVTRSEPIKIVRGNGRVITLPPIEAPTTRAKRRAQAHPPQPQTSLNNSTLTETSFDSSICSNTSFSMTNDASLNVTEKSAEKKMLETSSRRRSSKETGAANKSQRKSTSGRRQSKSQANKSRNETEASESQDDDDPNKLWCICRQPHNNRFMICCDMCEDWFHGTCVNITKAMGIEMEHKGVDWTCPKCVKKQEEKKQPRITDMLIANKKNDDLNISNDQQSTKNVEEKTVTPVMKTETLPTKTRLIEIKNIQTGQFVSLQDLSQTKKSPIRVIQKKLTTTSSTSAANTPTINALQKRTQHPESKQGGNTASNKNLLKSPQNPPFKVQKAVSMASVLNKNAEESFENCIVCRKSARSNAIYCSDECLSKYVRNVLQHTQQQNMSKSPEPLNAADEKKKKAKSLFEDLLSMADIKPKVERITVYERKSSRLITGNNAPTIANLKKWLQENPTFEVVLSGFTQPIEPENKIKQKSQQPIPTILNKEFNVSTSMSSTTPKDTQSTANVKPDQPETSTPPQKNVKQLVLNTLQPSSSSKQHKQTKTETKVKDEHTGSNKEKSTKRENSDGRNTSDHEPIRLTVRRTLKEQLLSRIKDYKKDIDTVATISPGGNYESERMNEINRFAEEVEEFAFQTEMQMYQLFNYDTGAKYRAKYRSLMFNIKDRKNRSLFTKICAKLINPEQLVRMSPDELASQELAQWRENEAKHQLEIIKKSELDLLACTKNYVLKTHKGEEVIEDKNAESVNLDLTIPVEDVFSMLNSTVDSNNENSQESSTSLRKDYGSFTTTDYDFHAVSHSETPSVSNEDEQKSKNRSKDHERDRDREADHQKTYSDKKNRGNDHYKGGKSRSHKRSRTRSRSGSRSREKRHKGSSHRDHTSGERDKDKKVESERKDKKSITTSSTHSSTTSKDANIATSSSTKEKQYVAKKINNKQKSMEVFNLVDQILESSKTVEEAANLVADKDIGSTKSVETTNSNLVAVESDQEPTSTVSIESPPQDPYMRYYGTNSPLSTNTDHLFIWSGIIHMIDVTTFQTTLQYLSRSSSSNFASCLPKSLEVVGRICPEIVWDYVSKIKKSPNKEIVVIRLLPSNESETSAYIELYQYLHSRNRLGVIKPESQQIRDFYIYPLGVGKRMPPVLQNSQDDDFFNDPYRPDILIGIIIRVLGKRPAPSTTLPLPSKSTVSKFSRVINASGSTQPPGSPKRKKILQPVLPKDDDIIDIDAIIKAPIVTKTKQAAAAIPSTITNVSDEDAPYSPGGSSDSDNQVPGLRRTTEAGSNTDQELKRKMEELNRQIAVQELEIAGLLKVDPSATPPATTNVLANISIPPDLSQILASIRSNPSVKSASFNKLQASTADEEYDPAESYSCNNTTNQRPTTSSRLAQLTEAELLRMVPDDIILDKKPTYTRGFSDEPPPPGV